MPRTSLAQLLPADPSPPAPAPAPSGDEPQRRTDRPARNRRPTGPAPIPEPEPEGDTGPRYLQLERKEARLRLDQADALAQLTRRLNRARGGKGERITDNTLIRVAVDLLLTKSGQLSGATEDELRESVSS